MERINQYGEQPVVLTLWRGAEQIQVSVEPVEASRTQRLSSGTLGER